MTVSEGNFAGGLDIRPPVAGTRSDAAMESGSESSVNQPAAKVAIVHYWLVGMRGGEKVLEALCELFPDADIYTHVYKPERISATIRRHRIHTTFIASLPFATRLYQAYLLLMPYALEALDLSGYDLVISSESGPAKGVLTQPGSVHVCYCHTPMRYLWSGFHEYRRQSGRLTRLAMLFALSGLRNWDQASATRVDHFIANSENVAGRIRKYYRRDATVIHPPVDLLEPTLQPAEDFYLYVGQLVAYKHADVVVDAFSRMGKKLIVIGRGEQYAALKRTAGPTVTLLGWADDSTLRDYYARCRALIFIADEDFGIVPVEAMSAGRPVIAWAGGGVLETVRDGESGILFAEQTAGCLIEAVHQFERVEKSFDPARIAATTIGFAKNRFKQRISNTIREWMDQQQAWSTKRTNSSL
jgi:glycosyltransferase involved in cell wall biosynthesis